MKERIGLRFGDVVLMISLAVAAVLLLFLPRLHDPKSVVAEILQVRTGEVQQVILTKDVEFVICSEGITLTVTVSSGRISVSHADCHDQICVNTPAISRVGQSIVCAPAGVVVRMVGEGEDADAVSG